MRRLVLHGERVTLRPYRRSELDEMIRQVEAATGPVMSSGSGPPLRERMELRLQHSGRFVDGFLDLAIEADGRLVGSIQARAPEQAAPPGVCELGIELVPEVRGQGMGTEAVSLLTVHLLEHGYARVEAATDVANTAMRRALESAGFALEGVMRGFMPTADGRADYALYAVTAGPGRR